MKSLKSKRLFWTTAVVAISLVGLLRINNINASANTSAPVGATNQKAQSSADKTYQQVKKQSQKTDAKDYCLSQTISKNEYTQASRSRSMYQTIKESGKMSAKMKVNNSSVSVYSAPDHTKGAKKLGTGW